MEKKSAAELSIFSEDYDFIRPVGGNIVHFDSLNIDQSTVYGFHWNDRNYTKGVNNTTNTLSNALLNSWDAIRHQWPISTVDYI